MKEETKGHKIYRVIMLIIVIALITFVVTSILSSNANFKYSSSNGNVTKKLDTLLATVTELINEKYIGDVDEEELIDGALKGLVEAVGDDYTEYYTDSELEEFESDTIGNYIGIGVYLQANILEGTIKVYDIIENTPAAESDLKVDDLILKVDGKEYGPDELSELTKSVKGEEGTKVTLTIKRGEEVKDIEIERRSVHVNCVKGEVLENNIGYISIEKFDIGCGEDFKNAYNDLVSKDIKALIVDVRDNGGGVVDEALEIADMFCEKGETTLIKIDKDGNEKVIKSENDATIKMPVVVLTNYASASASEILVAALKDNKKAEIVGEKTFGKGVIQELIYLPNGGALRVTASEYYTPNRDKINKEGIKPDYEVEFDYTNEEVDEQLNKAIEIIKQKM